jgi:2-dehydro-3-deoxyphosphogluconate aldolase/(4S)-4-hydroxy-2-oxoglutarate aldolase
MRHAIAAQLRSAGAMAIVRTASAESAVRSVEAIVEGGLPVVEISLTTPDGVRAIEQAADRLGDRVTLGAGTVLDAETARICLLAGARFLVSPALSRPVIETAARYSAMACPGALSPTEVLAAHEAGADLVKVFPCGCVGGPRYIRALKGPFPQIDLVPTGGVTIADCGEYLKAGAVAVGVGGAELMDPEDLRAGRYGAVTERTRRLLAAIAAARREMEA